MCKIHLCSFLLLAVNGLFYPFKILKLYPIITCYTFKKRGEGIFSQFSFQAIDRSDNASLSLIFDEYDMLLGQFGHLRRLFWGLFGVAFVFTLFIWRKNPVQKHFRA